MRKIFIVLFLFAYSLSAQGVLPLNEGNKWYYHYFYFNQNESTSSNSAIYLLEVTESSVQGDTTFSTLSLKKVINGVPAKTGQSRICKQTANEVWFQTFVGFETIFQKVYDSRITNDTTVTEDGLEYEVNIESVNFFNQDYQYQQWVSIAGSMFVDKYSFSVIPDLGIIEHSGYFGSFLGSEYIKSYNLIAYEIDGVYKGHLVNYILPLAKDTKWYYQYTYQNANNPNDTSSSYYLMKVKDNYMVQDTLFATLTIGELVNGSVSGDVTEIHCKQTSQELWVQVFADFETPYFKAYDTKFTEDTVDTFNGNQYEVHFGTGNYVSQELDYQSWLSYPSSEFSNEYGFSIASQVGIVEHYGYFGPFLGSEYTKKFKLVAYEIDDTFYGTLFNPDLVPFRRGNKWYYKRTETTYASTETIVENNYYSLEMIQTLGNEEAALVLEERSQTSSDMIYFFQNENELTITDFFTRKNWKTFDRRILQDTTIASNDEEFLVTFGNGNFIDPQMGYQQWENPGEDDGKITSQFSRGVGLTYLSRITKPTAETTVETEYTLIGYEFNGILTGGTTTGLEESEYETPESFALNQNYPNPFNPVTTISFNLPENGKVNLEVYDVIGRKVSTLVNSEMSAGKHSLKFNASNLASGIYFYQIRFNNSTTTRKMILMK